MSKRSSKGGDSPTPKTQIGTSSQKSDISLADGYLNNSFSFLDNQSEGASSEHRDTDFRFEAENSQTTPTASNETCFSSQQQENEVDSWSFLSSQSVSQPASQSAPCSPLRSQPGLDLAADEEHFDDDIGVFHFDPQPTTANLSDIITENIAKQGVTNTAENVLQNETLKKEIMKIIFQESHSSLKLSLKNSQLCADKSDRKFLLSLTPRSLCEEFRLNSSPTFILLVQGILGISKPEAVFDSQYLLNILSTLYSISAKCINRKATGYALLMTGAARDGGLREDSLKLFSMFVHVRTSQRYDKGILSVGWDLPLADALASEKEHFSKLHEALQRKSELDMEGATDFDRIDEEINQLLDTIPPQVQQVWDNLNLRTKHRYQRGRDEYAKNYFDWMASIFIKDRINANHMDSGDPVKNFKDLNIEDFVPSVVEKDYVFQSLVFYYSHRLVERYPMIFKSIKSSIKPNKPHQFQQEMDAKSDEFTGDLFTKSESNTEDLIGMMTEIQKKYEIFF